MSRKRIKLTFVLLQDVAVDLVHTGLDVIPGEVITSLLTRSSLQTHQLIDVPAVDTTTTLSIKEFISLFTFNLV